MKNIKEEISEIFRKWSDLEEDYDEGADQILSLISSKLPKEKDYDGNEFSAREVQSYNQCLAEIKDLIKTLNQS